MELSVPVPPASRIYVVIRVTESSRTIAISRHTILTDGGKGLYRWGNKFQPSVGKWFFLTESGNDSDSDALGAKLDCPFRDGICIGEECKFWISLVDDNENTVGGDCVYIRSFVRTLQAQERLERQLSPITYCAILVAIILFTLLMAML
jgi:hypothetical protein